MGCGSCGSGSGSPSGCKSNGGCSTGGCNRMNAYDWLHNLTEIEIDDKCRVIEVSFNNGSRKDFLRNTTLQEFEKGDVIAVEGVNGFDVGEVSLTGEIVRLQLKKLNMKEHNPEMKKILRIATSYDVEKKNENKAREAEALIRSRAIAKQLNLNLKMSQIEMQADGKKATFYYIADDRVDFRELIKIYATEFKVKVEMKQIGARQEAGKVGGIGNCGRELCCSSWLTDFKSVNTTAARYQNLSINQAKLSGQCGRLKCCLNYELDTYLDALQYFPENGETLELAKGRAFLVKKDIFKNIMWYQMAGSHIHFPLTVENVKDTLQKNAKGIRPEDVEKAEIISKTVKEDITEYVDLAGQTSLQTLDRNSKKDKGNSNIKNKNQQPQQQIDRTKKPLVVNKANKDGEPTGSVENKNANEPKINLGADAPNPTKKFFINKKKPNNNNKPNP